MRNSDERVLTAYLKMIWEGTAFDGWREKPDSRLRNDIIQFIVEGKGSINLSQLRELKNTISRTTNENQLRKAIKDIFLKEEDFKV